MAPIVRTGRQEELIAADPADTIFALASGRPPAAIAIIRLSGAGATDLAARIGGRMPAARQASLRRLRDPADGTVIDHGLVLLLPASRSPIGEDVVEFHLHGGRAVIDAMTSCLARLGARAAVAGEFTWRAFRNGRIDLTQVEGLSDLLAAETESQRRAALRVVDGALGAQIDGWRARLIAAAALVEAAIDFADEGDVMVSACAPVADLAALRAEMRRRIARPTSERLRDGVRVAIAGPPNAGKSTLFNALVGRDAAITSPIAGTTRDLIEAPVTIGGVPVVLIDMAGLRDDGGDAVERIGIARARGALDRADIMLWLGDGPPPETVSTVMTIHARADEVGRDKCSPGRDLALSAMTGDGVDLLTTRIVERASALLPAIDEVALSARHRDHVAACADAIDAAEGAQDPLIRAEHLREALTALDQLVGRHYVDDLLGAVFARFCIGK